MANPEIVNPMSKKPGMIRGTKLLNGKISKVVDTMIPLDETYFPDREFIKYLREHFDRSLDGKIDCSKVKEIFCCTRGIESLQGIEYFKNLKELYCSSNDLQGKLDLSSLKKLRTISCRGNHITELIVPESKKLTKICCLKNQLSTLKINNCPNLQELRCDNNEIQDLIIENCPTITVLEMYHNNIPSMDISGLPHLYFFQHDPNVTISDQHKRDGLWKALPKSDNFSYDTRKPTNLLLRHLDKGKYELLFDIVEKNRFLEYQIFEAGLNRKHITIPTLIGIIKGLFEQADNQYRNDLNPYVRRLLTEEGDFFDDLEKERNEQTTKDERKNKS